MEDRVHIQAQDTTGVWRTYTSTFNNSQIILTEMHNLKNRLPKFRVRAVDDNGRVVDILG